MGLKQSQHLMSYLILALQSYFTSAKVKNEWSYSSIAPNIGSRNLIQYQAQSHPDGEDLGYSQRRLFIVCTSFNVGGRREEVRK
jgi:hypothetical protein